MENIPRIGIAAIIKKDDKVLLGKRKGAHGAGTWSFPGGHLEFKEKIEDCAKREVLEETGLNIKNCKIATLTEDFFEKEDKHYITIYVVCEYYFGELKLLEPEKCEEWKWFSWNDFPKPLFSPVLNLIKQGFNPIVNHN